MNDLSKKSPLGHYLTSFIIVLLIVVSATAKGQTIVKLNSKSAFYIRHRVPGKVFTIASGGASAPIFVDPEDWKGVVRAAGDLGDDIRKVTGTASRVVQNGAFGNYSIIVGTIGKSAMIDQLIAAKQIDVAAIKGKWESFLIQTVGDHLVIAGSDKRGTIFGIYDLSERIGVSPWYWWADVPVKKSKSLYVEAGRFVQESPKVKYRGIFINDEDPSFSGWARNKFGGVNSKMYTHVFELLLRLKANLLWPAMWGKSFNEDDPLNPVLADEYGIVMGTSHHEPMMRAQKEYTDRKKVIGNWDYTTNAENIKKFWTDGLERNKSFDNLITIGMRGDGDVAMGEGNDADNIRTLRKVVADQRDIISKVYGKDSSEVPQAWAIFTEVQRYYNAGLTVPDDVTLLFCDNNWGYIRRTGPMKERDRKGGMGIYYHIDMNGGPWNDRWINTTTVAKLHEQLNLAYQTGINREWIINVGDLKPKELPIDFIMHFAWDPNAIPANKTWDYTVKWARSVFGEKHSEEIADIVSRYTKYNLWRKPEIQDPRIFSFVNYNEADLEFKRWSTLAARAETLGKQIAPQARDAYYELVLYPVKASAGVAEIYLDAGRNNLYAKQGRVSANYYAKQARDLFEIDKQLSNYYNDTLANGKWKNMMSDVHIGYRQWSMPHKNQLPELEDVIPLANPAMGIAVEGSEQSWPATGIKAELPVFDVLNKQHYFIELFNRGTGPFQFTAKVDKPWVKVSLHKGVVNREDVRLDVSIDWKSAPTGKTDARIDIRQGNIHVPVAVTLIKSNRPQIRQPYYGGRTEFSVPAQQFSANKPGKQARWTVLPDLGRGEACMGITPVQASSAIPLTAPVLEYRIFLPDTGVTKVCLGILPTQDINPERGLRIAVAIDNQTPKIIDARKGFHDEFNEYTPAGLAMSPGLKPLPPLGQDYALISRGKPRRNEVFDNLRWLDADINIKVPGIHKLKIFMVDPEVVLENIIINPNDKYPSYFGAPPVKHSGRGANEQLNNAR